MSVLTPPVLTQLDDLRQQFADATWSALSNGTAHVRVPNVKLPAGWSKPTATIHLVLPVGYPVAKPDCFWADHDLRLAGDKTPENSGVQAIPGLADPLLWFSWHIAAWNPNAHNVLTWLRVALTRFDALK